MWLSVVFLRVDGLKGLFRGLPASLMGIVPYSGTDLALFYTLRARWMAANPDAKVTVMGRCKHILYMRRLLLLGQRSHRMPRNAFVHTLQGRRRSIFVDVVVFLYLSGVMACVIKGRKEGGLKCVGLVLCKKGCAVVRLESAQDI